MSERPILFSAPMVRAILEGRKTQTRRIIKRPLKHPGWTEYVYFGPSANNPTCVSRVIECGPDYPDDDSDAVLCPYGAPGERLWVRETWAHYQTVNSVRRPSGASFAEVSDGLAGYRADGHETIEDFRKHVQLMSGCDLEAVEINGDRWRPSIHMPRWASRLSLEITGVRVERVQAISYEDACAEGCAIPSLEVPAFETVTLPAGSMESWDQIARRLRWPQRFYEQVWESINGADSWAANPWVWVVEFKRAAA
jgi:hypothetical protein